MNLQDEERRVDGAAQSILLSNLLLAYGHIHLFAHLFPSANESDSATKRPSRYPHLNFAYFSRTVTSSQKWWLQWAITLKLKTGCSRTWAKTDQHEQEDNQLENHNY